LCSNKIFVNWWPVRHLTHSTSLVFLSNDPKVKFLLIADFQDGDITTRTKAIIDDYLKIDDRVLEQTNMSAFLITKVHEPNGGRRAESVYQLLQKLREDVTDMRAALMKQITDICNRKYDIVNSFFWSERF
jgi:hypothetical protein